MRVSNAINNTIKSISNHQSSSTHTVETSTSQATCCIPATAKPAPGNSKKSTTRLLGDETLWLNATVEKPRIELTETQRKRNELNMKLTFFSKLQVCRLHVRCFIVFFSSKLWNCFIKFSRFVLWKFCSHGSKFLPILCFASGFTQFCIPKNERMSLKNWDYDDYFNRKIHLNFQPLIFRGHLLVFSLGYHHFVHPAKALNRQNHRWLP